MTHFPHLYQKVQLSGRARSPCPGRCRCCWTRCCARWRRCWRCAARCPPSRRRPPSPPTRCTTSPTSCPAYSSVGATTLEENTRQKYVKKELVEEIFWITKSSFAGRESTVKKQFRTLKSAFCSDPKSNYPLQKSS